MESMKSAKCIGHLKSEESVTDVNVKDEMKGKSLYICGENAIDC